MSADLRTITINLQTHRQSIFPLNHTLLTHHIQQPGRTESSCCRCFPYRSSLNRSPCVVASALQPLRLPPKAIWGGVGSECVWGGRKTVPSCQDWDKMDEVTSSCRNSPGYNHVGQFFFFFQRTFFPDCLGKMMKQFCSTWEDVVYMHL